MNVVIVTLLATFCIQSGFLLWKMAADSLPIIGKDKLFIVIKGFLFNFKWVAGYIILFFGWVLTVKALDIGEISLVQPLISVGDVFLFLMSVFLLKERLLPFEWLGLFVIILGAAALSFDAKATPIVKIDWSRILIYHCIAIAAWVVLMLNRKGRRAEITLALAVGIAFGVGGVLTKLMTTYIRDNAQQLNSLASVVNPIFPLMVIANVAGLYLLQMAFQNGRAAVIIPVQLAVLNGMSVLAGMTLFAEEISSYRIVCIFFIIGGTIVLKWAGSKKKSSELPSESEEKALTTENKEN
jgi:uncharacterized membrane protein